jgi:C4-dicarboxylate-specific signal transduction histidine kinase
MERLGRLARQAGLRLDVRRDVALEPLVRGMEGLRAMESVLRRPERADARAPDRLRHLSELLNRTAYKALGAEARRLSALVLDEELISAVDARVRQEPSFQGVVLPDLELEMPKGRVVVQHLRGDLEDVLANLLRNAANALLDQGGSRLGMRVEEEEDEITGMEAVSIRVLDDAPGRITESMIRGREAGRGLGLVVDLVTRHDGSVTVEERANERKEGWTKAVVVRLRRAEEGRGRGGE